MGFNRDTMISKISIGNVTKLMFSLEYDLVKHYLVKEKNYLVKAKVQGDRLLSSGSGGFPDPRREQRNFEK